MRRLTALTLGLVALVCAATPAVAAAPGAGGVRVRIETAGGTVIGKRFVTQAAMAESTDLVGRYVSAQALAGLVGIAPDSVVRMGIARVGAADDVPLGGEELRAGIGVFDTAYNAGLVRYARTPDTDPPGEQVAPANQDPFHVTIETTGRQLHVTAGADRQQVEVGDTVTLTGQADDVPAGTTVSYFWSFGDTEEEDPGAQAPHVFAANGTYDATLTAVAEDGSSGISERVVIQVGTAPAAPDADAPTPAPPGRSPEPEPVGGGTGGRQAPTSGPARSSGTGSRPTRGHPHAPARRTAARPPASGDDTADDHTPTPAPVAAPAPTPAPTPAAAPPAPTAPTAVRAPAKPPRAQHRAAGHPRPSAGDTVRGLVLTGFHGEPLPAPAAATATSPASSRAPVRAASGAEPGAIAPWLVVLAGLVLLLGLGAALELRHRGRPLDPA